MMKDELLRTMDVSSRGSYDSSTTSGSEIRDLRLSEREWVGLSRQEFNHRGGRLQPVYSKLGYLRSNQRGATLIGSVGTF